MWPENHVSRVPGEVEHQETLFVMYFLQRRVNFSVEACIHLDFVYTIPETSTILVPTQMWPGIKVCRVLGGVYHS